MRKELSAALVTGGASGLGEAVARRLGADGWRVAVLDRDGQRASAIASELGETARAFTVDVANAEEIDETVREIATDAPLRLAVSCAGVAPARRLLNREGPHPSDLFQRTVAVNLLGTFHVLRSAAAAMAANEPDARGSRGVIVNTASIAAFEGQIGQVAYAASKAGVVGLTLPAARELAQLGIRVCAIAPGTFATPMLQALPEEARKGLAAAVPFPPRLGEPDEFADLVVTIVRNQMLNGEVIRLDGALRMAPR